MITTSRYASCGPSLRVGNAELEMGNMSVFLMLTLYGSLFIVLYVVIYYKQHSYFVITYMKTDDRQKIYEYAAAMQDKNMASVGGWEAPAATCGCTCIFFSECHRA